MLHRFPKYTRLDCLLVAWSQGICITLSASKPAYWAPGNVIYVKCKE